MLQQFDNVLVIHRVTRGRATKYTAAMARGPTNITGFDVKKLVAASGQPAKDPWARNEAWRYTGPFTRANRLRGSFPGLGIATVAFAVYCGYEYLFLKDDHKHGSGHSDSTSSGH